MENPPDESPAMRSRLSFLRTRSLSFLLSTNLPAVIFLLVLYFVSSLKGRSFSDLAEDPVAISRSRAIEAAKPELGLRPWEGIVSNLGNLLWCSSATLCLFTALSLRRSGCDRTLANCLLALGLLTVVLLVDDFFLLHDHTFPLRFGIRQKWLLLCYGAMALSILTGFWRTILKSRFSLLGAALFFFAVSLYVDRSFPKTTNFSHFAEDGSKFLGIANWFAYLASTSFQGIRALPTASPPRA